MTTIKKVAGWKVYPNPMRDEELVRFVMSDPDVSNLERNLAQRLERILYKCDDLEIDVENAKHDKQNWVQMELF